jgi:hypothetical protein
MKKNIIRIFFLLIPLAIFTYSCSEEAPILPSTPIANAGEDQLVEIFDTVYLNANLIKISEDVEYIWSFDYKPTGSTAVFSDSSSAKPYFIPDAEGFFSATLVIRKRDIYSKPDYVTIHSVLKKSKNYFPNSVGDEWHYKVTEYETGNTLDTIKVEIVGSTTMPDGRSANIWIYSGKEDYFYRSDTVYAVENEDTIIFYYLNDFPHKVDVSYIIPFEAGNYWVFPYPIDCRYIEPVTVKVGAFNNSFYLWRIISFGGPVPQYTIGEWVVPNFGIVKKTLYHEGTAGGHPERNENWDLIYYNFPE